MSYRSHLEDVVHGLPKQQLPVPLIHTYDSSGKLLMLFPEQRKILKETIGIMLFPIIEKKEGEEEEANVNKNISMLIIIVHGCDP